MTPEIMQRIADWHGVQAAHAYHNWRSIKFSDDAKEAFVYHIAKADNLWKKFSSPGKKAKAS